MRDPYTQVCEFPRYRGFLHRLFKFDGALFTVWHRDRGGDDGACGWSYPHLTEDEILRIRDFAWWEERDPYFLRCPSKGMFHGSRHEAECLYRQLVLLTARAIRLKITLDQATLIAIERTSIGGFEDAARAFCYQPGYHTNHDEDKKGDRQDRFAWVMCSVARDLKARFRPWYRHPRWHVHHWRVTVHPWNRFRAWWILRRKSRLEVIGGDYADAPPPSSPSYTFGPGTLYVNGVEAGKVESVTVEVGKEV